MKSRKVCIKTSQLQPHFHSTARALSTRLKKMVYLGNGRPKMAATRQKMRPLDNSKTNGGATFGVLLYFE